MHGLIFETSIWLLAGSTRFLQLQSAVCSQALAGNKCQARTWLLQILSDILNFKTSFKAKAYAFTNQTTPEAPLRWSARGAYDRCRHLDQSEINPSDFFPLQPSRQSPWKRHMPETEKLTPFGWSAQHDTVWKLEFWYKKFVFALNSKLVIVKHFSIFICAASTNFFNKLMCVMGRRAVWWSPETQTNTSCNFFARRYAWIVILCVKVDIYVFVCMHVFVYVCVCVDVCVYVYVNVCMCMYASMFAYSCVYVNVCTFV